MATPATNVIELHKAMQGKVNESDLRRICQYVVDNSLYCTDLDYSGLTGNGPGNKILSLIDYCRRRRALAIMIDGINQVRPDVLGANAADWRGWAAGEDAK